MPYKNKHDADGECSSRGYNTELDFSDKAKSLGYTIRPSTREEQFSHVDFFVKRKGKPETKIDVKSLKKKSRQDNEVDNQCVWLEFQNVKGKKGWIYGDADFICFERPKKFSFIARNKLASWCEKNIEMNKEPVSSSKKAYKKLYRRFKRQDRIAWVNWSDIEHLEAMVWKK